MILDWWQALVDAKYFVLGGAAAAFVLMFLWAWLRRPPRVMQAFNSEGGQVLVTRRAVKDLVQRCCEELGGVGSADVTVRIRSGELHTRVELRLRRNANLKGISGYLREQIAQALTENLGVEKLGEIDILVVGVIEEPKTEV